MKKFLLSASTFACLFLSAQTTVTYSYTGAMQTFTVPACVTTVTITCYGAQGENALVGGATGGLGGSASGELSVTTGQTLNIFVGGQNGYNGGGAGGINGNDQFSGAPIGTYGGSGGGASDVRVGGTTINDRVIVGGGGGGAGHNGVWPGCQVAGPGGNGGAGGGSTGGTGGYGVGTPCNCGGGGGDGGLGGTQVAGGVHGSYYGNTACLRSSWTAGADGTLFQGGAGALTYHNGSGGSGGGGGGYYGGGAGGNGSDTTPGGGGGGGSSWTGTLTNTAIASGVRTGNGEVVISYIIPSGNLPASPVNFSGPAAACIGSAITYSIDTVSGANSYTWTAPGSWTIISGQGTTTVTVVVGSSTDTLWAAATNSCGTGPASYTVVAVNPTPTLDLGASFTNCGPAVLTADPAASYLWGGGETTQTLTVTMSGTYSVTITDVNGCTNSDTVTVAIDAVPALNLGPDTANCTGVVLTADTAASYLWGGGETTQTISVTASGTYSVTITGANGCTNTDDVNVTIHGNPTVVASAAMNFVCAADDSVQLFGSPSGGTFTGPGVIPGDMFDPVAAGSGVHNIVYSYTDPNGCSGIDTTTITVDICLGVSLNEGEGFSLYPNPASSSVTITFASALQTGTVEIANMQGQVVQSQQVNNAAAGSQVTIDLENLAAGTYMLSVISGDSRVVRTLTIQ